MMGLDCDWVGVLFAGGAGGSDVDRLGHTSHYILTNIVGNPVHFEEDCYDEFAIDQENQVRDCVSDWERLLVLVYLHLLLTVVVAMIDSDWVVAASLFADIRCEQVRISGERISVSIERVQQRGRNTSRWRCDAGWWRCCEQEKPTGACGGYQLRLGWVEWRSGTGIRRKRAAVFVGRDGTRVGDWIE